MKTVSFWAMLFILTCLVSGLVLSGCNGGDGDDDDDDDAGDDDTGDDDTGDDDTGDDDTGDDDTGDDDTGDDDTGDDDTTPDCDCEIDGGCQDDGETNPENVCQFCDPAQSMTAWSDNNGVTCDDGVFCNGADTCDAGSCSAHAGDPCDAQCESCNEGTDVCDAQAGSCDDGVFCNGDDTCSGGSCSQHAGDPCLGGDACNNTCNEDAGDCFSLDTTSCDDGVFCNGDDMCDGAGECEHPGDPCDALWEYCSEDDGECLDEFVAIPHGTFTMGSPGGELGRQVDETQHSVTLTNDFEVSVVEVTQDRFTMLMGWNPSYWGPNGPGEECGSDCPADQMSWFDALAYTNELSFEAGYSPCYNLASVVCVDGTNVDTNYMLCMSVAKGGIATATVTLNGAISVYECEGYRLLTESEYEYATRAGTSSAFYSGAISQTGCEPLDSNLDAIGWYCGNCDEPQPVRQKAPNAWDLYDISGNVWEWNWDWYGAYPGATTDPEGPSNGTERTLGGGSYYDGAAGVRSAIRGKIAPSLRYGGVGLRVARTLEPVTPGFKHIYAGTFTMGSPEGELGRNSDETQHTVTLTRDFEVMSVEVTQGFFDDLMGYNPSHFGPNGAGTDCGTDCPVEQVSWHEALALANALSVEQGLPECFDCTGTLPDVSCSLKASYSSIYDCPGYRLPTESEWEYAIRAGTATAFYNGAITYTDCTLDPNLDAIGWYCGNQYVMTEEVGQKLPNASGLYDMSGNAWEWVWDWYGTYPGTVTDPVGPTGGSNRVLRGGTWLYNARYCRSAHRFYYGSGVRESYLGFRLARSLPYAPSTSSE